MSPRILVVEDDIDTRSTLVALLRKEGYEVQGAADGGDAISVIEHGYLPTIVLADLQMPGIVGQELVEYLRSHHEVARSAVAIITATPESAPQGVPVFAKPTPYAKVLQFVREHEHDGDRRAA